MKRLLLITGDIAAGKTTFSNQLAQRYSVAVFQKDTIKEILGDNIGFRDRGMVLAGGCGPTEGAPQIAQTGHLEEAYAFGRSL